MIKLRKKQRERKNRVKERENERKKEFNRGNFLKERNNQEKIQR